jgi:hypothetical protein
MPNACRYCDPLPCLEWHVAAISVRKWFRKFVLMGIKPLPVPQRPNKPTILHPVYVPKEVTSNATRSSIS